MSFLSAIRVALGALLVNKGRSVLTSLGIVIGISAVISMVSAGDGARSYLDERLETVGKNLILIQPGGRTQQGMMADFVPLTRPDAAAIRKQVGPLLVGVAESQLTIRLASTPSANHLATLVGSVPDLQKIRAWTVTFGRFYSEEDVQRRTRVCLLGQTARQRLFPNKLDPSGEMVRIGHVPLQVIGVLGEKGRSPTGADQDDIIAVPITTLQHLVVGEEKLSIIVCAARSEELVERARGEIVKVLRERHRVKASGTDDFTVSSVQEMAELAWVLTSTMQVLVAIIASISLLVGGIGIMNIMLVSVTERTREIGIRMAVGATSADVLLQFLIEAVVLALGGGIIGISLGIAGAVALAYLASWPIVVQPATVLLAFAVSAAVGVFFGYYPALRASRLDPIEALRYE